MGCAAALGWRPACQSAHPRLSCCSVQVETRSYRPQDDPQPEDSSSVVKSDLLEADPFLQRADQAGFEVSQQATSGSGEVCGCSAHRRPASVSRRPCRQSEIATMSGGTGFRSSTVTLCTLLAASSSAHWRAEGDSHLMSVDVSSLAAALPGTACNRRSSLVSAGKRRAASAATVWRVAQPGQC